MGNTLVFVIPFGALPNYIFPAAAWAKKLMEKGYKIVWIKCNQAMDSTCVVHYTLKVEEKKANRHRICNWCRSYQNSVLEELGCEGFVLNPADDSELLDFDLDLKKLSAYTLMFSYKCLSLEELEQKYPEELSRYEKMNRVLLTQFERLKSKIDFSNSQIIVFHSMYPYASALGAWAQSQNIACLSYLSGYSLAHINESVSISKIDIETATMQLARFYESHWRSLRYSQKDIDRFYIHMESALFKRNIKNYSRAKTGRLSEITEKIGLTEGKKFVILACGSSNDEIAGSEAARESCFGSSSCAVFPDQISWFKALVERYSHRDDVILILRPHPRELTYQDGGHWNWLIDLKGKIPNVVLSDSAMDVSSFDLMDLADLCLVSISSAGLESMSFGLPVISIWPSQTCWPVEERFRYVSNPEVYFETIEEMIRERPARRFETALLASGYGAFLVSANNAYFSINGFWEKNTGPNSMDPVEKQRRINLDLPVLNFKKYLDDFQIEDDELEKFCHVLNTGEEMYCGFLRQASKKTFNSSTVLKAMIELWMKTVESCDAKQLDLNKTYKFFQGYLACAESRATEV